jgi:hypothetical protein
VNVSLYSRKDRALSKALSIVLPTPDQTDLLRACLHSGTPARKAWQQWQERVGGLEKALNDGTPGVKSLLPLLQRSAVVEDTTSKTLVRTAYLREKLRSTTYSGICARALGALVQSSVPILVLKGAAAAETVYDEPGLRHCHDLDLLAAPRDFERVSACLESLGWVLLSKNSTDPADSVRFEHKSGLPLGLHGRLFRLPYYQTPLEEVWSRSERQVIAGVSSRIMSMPDNLMHICGHASCCGNRESLRWVCDAWFILQRHSDLNWTSFVDCAIKSRLGLPLSITLGFLASEMQAPVPEYVLDRLNSAAHDTGSVGKSIAILGAQSTARGSFMNMIRTASSWYERASLTWLFLFPPLEYFRWTYRISSPWLLPFYYVGRPVGYVFRRIRARTRAVHGAAGRLSSPGLRQ